MSENCSICLKRRCLGCVVTISVSLRAVLSVKSPPPSYALSETNIQTSRVLPDDQQEHRPGDAVQFDDGMEGDESYASRPSEITVVREGHGKKEQCSQLLDACDVHGVH